MTFILAVVISTLLAALIHSRGGALRYLVRLVYLLVSAPVRAAGARPVAPFHRKELSDTGRFLILFLGACIALSLGIWLISLGSIPLESGVKLKAWPGLPGVILCLVSFVGFMASIANIGEPFDKLKKWINQVLRGDDE